MSMEKTVNPRVRVDLPNDGERAVNLLTVTTYHLTWWNADPDEVKQLAIEQGRSEADIVRETRIAWLEMVYTNGQVGRFVGQEALFYLEHLHHLFALGGTVTDQTPKDKKKA